jgi:hypothetical protein
MASNKKYKVEAEGSLATGPTAVEAEESVSTNPTAGDVVAAVETVRRWILAQRATIAAKGGDATPMAGELAAALVDADARIPGGRGDELRWFINETPTPLADPHGFGGAQALIVYILAALKRGALFPGVDERLADVARHWPRCRSKAEAEAKVGALESERADVIARDAMAKHEQWLASRPNTAPKPAPVAVPPEAKPLFSDDNELTVG